MPNIKLNLPGAPFTGQSVTFRAPCGCDQVTDGLSINGVIYTVVDAMGNCVTGKGGAWCSGAQVSVVLDVEGHRAFMQNTTVPAEHNHTKSEITDFPSSMTPTAHNQAASTITAGTFAGQVVANGSGQTPGTSLLRNSRLVSADTNPTVNGEICWTYK